MRIEQLPVLWQDKSALSWSEGLQFNEKLIKKIWYIIILVALWCFVILASKTASNELEPPNLANHLEPYLIAPSGISSAREHSRWEMTSLIYTTAQEYHIDPELFLRIAKCESALNPTAKNPLSTASGLFQFLNSTYSFYAKRYGISLEKNDPRNQAELAARMIADGKISAWNESKSCWNTIKPGQAGPYLIR